MRESVVTLFRGMVMGIAEIIPGVSGSTLALIMGIYDDFINFLSSISDFFKSKLKFIARKHSFEQVKQDFKKINFKFGVFLLLGMALSLALFSHIITYLLETYPQYVFGFFFGLVLSSIVIPWQEMKQKGVRQIAIIILTFLVFFVVLGAKPLESPSSNPVFLFFAGALAICAMVLPGISGSFIFLLLGVYDYVIGLLKSLTKLDVGATEIINIAAVGLGIVIGFSIFVRFLKKGLEKYPSEIFAFLIGIMLASLRVLWPFMKVDQGVEVAELTKVMPWSMPLSEVALIIFFTLIAVAIVAILKKFAKPKNLDHIQG